MKSPSAVSLWVQCHVLPVSIVTLSLRGRPINDILFVRVTLQLSNFCLIDKEHKFYLILHMLNWAHFQSCQLFRKVRILKQFFCYLFLTFSYFFTRRMIMWISVTEIKFKVCELNFSNLISYGHTNYLKWLLVCGYWRIGKI